MGLWGYSGCQVELKIGRIGHLSECSMVNILEYNGVKERVDESLRGKFMSVRNMKVPLLNLEFSPYRTKVPCSYMKWFYKARQLVSS